MESLRMATLLSWEEDEYPTRLESHLWEMSALALEWAPGLLEILVPEYGPFTWCFVPDAKIPS